MKITSQKRPLSNRIEMNKYNLNGLYHSIIKYLYQTRLDENLDAKFLLEDSGKLYCHIMNSIQTAAEEALLVQHQSSHNGSIS